MNKIVIKDKKSDMVDIFRYPDGQHGVTLKLDQLKFKVPVHVVTRLKDWNDIEILLSVVAALEKCDYRIEIVEIVYLIGARSDRAFHLGQCNYLKDVIYRVIGSSVKPHVLSFHLPHNQMFGSGYYGLGDTKICLPNYIRGRLNKCVFVAGDCSAKDVFGTNHYFDKKRIGDKIKMKLYLDQYIHPDKKIVVIDDLCDGGATFIEAGKILNEMYPDNDLYLAVYHGLFTKGFDELGKYYKKIFTTNSYQDIDHPLVHQFNVI